MMRRRMLKVAAAVLALAALPLASAQAGVFVNIGVPLPWYGPYHHHHSYYGPRVVVVAPPVVIGAPPPPPVIYQQPTVIYTPAPPPVVVVPAPAP